MDFKRVLWIIDILMRENSSSDQVGVFLTSPFAEDQVLLVNWDHWKFFQV